MMTWLFPTTAGLLFAIGLYGTLRRTELIRRLLAINLMATAIFLFLILLATRTPNGLDPVPQAMILTGIVIAVSLTAFALALVRHYRRVTRRASLEEEAEERDGG